MQFDKNTPQSEITIQGLSFKVPQPYAAGHALNKNEASALNQVMGENVRNNMANRIKKAIDEAGGAENADVKALQKEVTDYCKEYEFGQRRAGGRTADPVEREALRIAKDKVRNAIRQKGINLSDVSTAQLNELAADALEKNPGWRDTARAIVEKQQEVGDAELDLGGLS